MANAFPPPTGDPVGDGVLRARSEPTRDEFVWSFRALMRVAGKRVPRGSLPVFGVALAMGLFVASDGWFRWVLIGTGAFGLLVTALLAAMPHLMYRSVPADRRVQTIECSAAGISSGTDDARVTYSWDAVSHVVRGEAATVLVTHERGEGILVPHRGLDADQRRTLDELITRHAARAETLDLR